MERVLRRTKLLSTKAPPAVQAVYIRTLLNGWVTSRRMRHCTNVDNLPFVCLFCKKGNDSLEHFGRCRSVISFFASVQITIHNLQSFLGLDQEFFPDCFPNLARAIASVYLARNVLIHGPASYVPHDLLRNFYIQLCN
jgi:hypothetical protein